MVYSANKDTIKNPDLQQSGRGNLLDERPGQCAQNRIAEPDIPGLGPVEIRIFCPVAENAQRIQCIVCRPLQLERQQAPLPHPTLRMLLAYLRQLLRKRLFLHFERRFELNVVR